MTIKLKEVLLFLDKIAPPGMAEDWDNSGLQVGRLSQDVKKIMVALDPTIEALEEAVALKAQLLLTHHPLIFEPLSCIECGSYPGDVISEALKGDISILAMHTNLDITPGGINDMLSKLIKLKKVEVLQQIDDREKEKGGLGRIGNLPKGRPLAKIVDDVKAAMRTPNPRVLGAPDRKIKRIAVVGGAGGSMVSAAFKKSADLLITGDVRHHEALEAKSKGLALIDAGHFHTEKAALKDFTRSLIKKTKSRNWGVDIVFYEDEGDPMKPAP